MTATIGTTDSFLYLAIGLFLLGLLGVLLRRNALMIMMSVELMLNAANLSFVAYGRRFADPHVTLLVLVVIAVAAAEAAVGLAVVLGLFRTRQLIDVVECDLLREEL